MSSTVDPPNTGNSVTLCRPCIRLTDRIESGTTSIDLTQNGSARVRDHRNSDTHLLDQPVSRTMSEVVCQLLI